MSNDLRAQNSKPARWRRPLVVLTLSLLLHLALLNWASGRWGIPGGPATPSATEAVITASLQAAPPAVSHPTASAPPAPAPKPRIRPNRPTRAVAQKVAAPPTPPEPAPPAESASASLGPLPLPLPREHAYVPDIGDNPGGLPPLEPLPTGKVASLAGADAATAASAAASSPVKQYKTELLPSAEVHYDVKALRDGKTVYGSGKIGWRTSGDSYTIDGEAGILFFSVLTFKSEGSVAADGITPLRYNEKRFRKAATNTHFQRENHLISFSASTTTYPRTGGEQDRASVIWQLAAIGRGDPAQFEPGASFDLFVAGVRDGEIWSIKAIGQEDLDIAGGALSAWHLVRLPRAGSYDTQVDIWLAPTRGWYPVRLRQTERNGDVLDMTMTSISQ